MLLLSACGKNLAAQSTLLQATNKGYLEKLVITALRCHAGDRVADEVASGHAPLCGVMKRSIQVLLSFPMVYDMI
ncbi:hypothetical protein GF1_20910 [Desulfolithobacter dissulfuricans]|uniref:Uncharacterized protein n=1 Tax=Desulfolithobacter dissulfuricans TaxID=2795293 RepID=A0A915XIZ1_9BACT|nr:hypothetical protein GF1_20910 [Desulfolithobacter dissulfuricans]